MSSYIQYGLIEGNNFKIEHVGKGFPRIITMDETILIAIIRQDLIERGLNIPSPLIVKYSVPSIIDINIYKLSILSRYGIMNQMVYVVSLLSKILDIPLVYTIGKEGTSYVLFEDISESEFLY